MYQLQSWPALHYVIYTKAMVMNLSIPGLQQQQRKWAMLIEIGATCFRKFLLGIYFW